jgi:hypothetical protein
MPNYVIAFIPAVAFFLSILAGIIVMGTRDPELSAPRGR